MISDLDAMFSCIFNLCDVRLLIAIACIVPSGLLQGYSSKRSLFFVGNFIMGKSVGIAKITINIQYPYFFNLSNLCSFVIFCIYILKETAYVDMSI